MRTLLKPSIAVVAGLAGLVASCRNQPNPSENAPVAAVRPSASVAASAAPPAPPVPLASGQHAAAELAYPGQDQSVGKWVESSAFKFKVTNVVRCADPAPDEKVPVDRKVRVGAFVQVFSKYDNFFVTPRDVTLENGGVILNSERDAKAGADCKPLLAPARIAHEQTLGGVVIFQVPDETFSKDGIVAFKPTRWGGAPRAEIKVSEVVAAKPAGK